MWRSRSDCSNCGGRCPDGRHTLVAAGSLPALAAQTAVRYVRRKTRARDEASVSRNYRAHLSQGHVVPEVSWVEPVRKQRQVRERRRRALTADYAERRGAHLEVMKRSERGTLLFCRASPTKSSLYHSRA